MITPVLADESWLQDVRAANRAAAGACCWWLGQSGFLVQHCGRHLLFDPYLSDSLTAKYAQTDKPHVRMTERVVDPRSLDFIDVVTSSHNHTDHLDAETLVPLLAQNPQLTVVVPAANQQFAADRLGVPLDRLLPVEVGRSVTAAGMTITPVPAAHETIERDELGRHRFVGYVVEWEGLTLYHSGDTIRYEGMAECLRRWSIDVAFLPINGRLPERRVAGNLWGEEAAELARDAQIRLVIPCHYQMFEFNTVEPDDFEAACRRLGQPYRLLRAGERCELQRHHSSRDTTTA